MNPRQVVLFVLDAHRAGVWVRGPGLLSLASEDVSALMGACSFCRTTRRPLYGAIGSPPRICSRCLEACQHTLEEETGVSHEGGLLSRAPVTPPLSGNDPILSLIDSLARDPTNVSLLSTLRTSLDGDVANKVPRTETSDSQAQDAVRSCSFCDSKTGRWGQPSITGRGVEICYECILESLVVRATAALSVL